MTSVHLSYNLTHPLSSNTNQAEDNLRLHRHLLLLLLLNRRLFLNHGLLLNRHLLLLLLNEHLNRGCNRRRRLRLRHGNLRPNIQPMLEPRRNRQPRMQRPPIPTPIGMQIPPEHRAPGHRLDRQPIIATLHELAPARVLLVPGRRQLREPRPAVRAVAVEDAEEGALAVVGAPFRRVGRVDPVVVCLVFLADLVGGDLDVDVVAGHEALELGGAVGDAVDDFVVDGEVGGRGGAAPVEVFGAVGVFDGRGGFDGVAARC